jgi:Tfp pilus assembly protein PilF
LRCRIPWLAVLVLWVTGPGCASLKLLQSPTLPELDYEAYTSEEHCNFGVVYEESGDLERAQRQYSWAIRKDPGNYVAYTNRGNLEYRRGSWETAEASYRKAIALQGDYLPARNNLAVLLIERRVDPRGAIEILLPAAVAPPPDQDVEVFETLSRAYRAAGDETQAAAFLLKAASARAARERSKAAPGVW